MLTKPTIVAALNTELTDRLGHETNATNSGSRTCRAY